MRILVIHSFYKPGLPSGENDVVLSQADLLRRHGFEVLVWGPTSPNDMGIGDRLRIGASVIRGSGADPTQVISDFAPDLIHVHNLFPNISTKWISEALVPVVMSIHNYRTTCANGTFIRESKPCTLCLHGAAFHAITHACYMDSRVATIPVLGFQKHVRQAINIDIDTLIYTSEHSRDLLAGMLQPKSTAVIPNFVPAVAEVEDRNSKVEYDYFIVIGRLSPEKGIEGLLRIWPTGTRLIVVGEGPQRGELEAVSDRKWVEFKGYVDAATRDTLISGARALILPSVTPEADPVVVAQSLSAGTPVITLAHTATSRLATETGAIRTYSDAASLAQALLNQDPDKRAEARRIYSERWSEEAWMAAYRMILPAY